MDEQAKADALRIEVTLCWAKADRGELRPADALLMILDRIDTHLAMGCVVEEGSGAVPSVRSKRFREPEEGSVEEPTPPVCSSFSLNDSLGRPSGRLTFHGTVEASLGERLAHVVGRVRGLELRHSAASSLRHDIGNTLAALLSNIELMELLIGDADPSSAFLEEATTQDRQSFLRGLELTATSARNLVVSFERLRGQLG